MEFWNLSAYREKRKKAISPHFREVEKFLAGNFYDIGLFWNSGILEL